MEKEKILEKIVKDFAYIKSFEVKNDDGGDVIELAGKRYGGKNPDSFATESQLNYVYSLKNVVNDGDWLDMHFGIELAKANRFFMAACITIAKTYPNQKFIINV